MAKLSKRERQIELARQNRILSRADRVFMRRFYADLNWGSQQMIARYRVSGAYPELPDELRARIEQTYVDLVATTSEAFAERILDQGKALGYALEVKSFAEFFQRMALEYITHEAVRQRITAVTETTRSVIIRAIDKGQKEGLSVAEIAKNMTKDVPRISRWRASVIARTETHGAANYGAFEASKATGLPLKKEWISAQDHRTRDGVDSEFDHVSADGQAVDMDQPFRILKRDGSFEELMFPGDPAGSAGNVINCRCASGQFVEGS